jgi:hypothetical protein
MKIVPRTTQAVMVVKFCLSFTKMVETVTSKWLISYLLFSRHRDMGNVGLLVTPACTEGEQTDSVFTVLKQYK